MIFAIQTYIEDFFNSRGLDDSDQYSVALAKLYDLHRQSKSDTEFLGAMKRVRTVFYKRNELADRNAFDRKMLTRLDAKFKKKVYRSSPRQSQQRLRFAAVA
jgi:hypothetical protein